MVSWQLGLLWNAGAATDRTAAAIAKLRKKYSQGERDDANCGPELVVVRFDAAGSGPQEQDLLVAVLVGPPVGQMMNVVSYVRGSVDSGNKSHDSNGSSCDAGQNSLRVVSWWCETHQNRLR